jgi:hypothetical protein
MCENANPNREAGSDDDSVTFIPNPNSKKAKANHKCYMNGIQLHDTHPKSSNNGGWIWAENRLNSKQRSEDVRSLISEFQSMAQTNKEINRDSVLNLASKHNVTCGKWLVNLKAEYVAEAWENIRDAVFDGKLGEVAKIANEANNGTFVVCIYCADFGDKADVSIS